MSLFYSKSISCFSLKSETIGKNIKQIANDAFHGCGYSLSEITVDENNQYFYVENNCLIRKADKTIIIATNDAVIPNDIEILGGSSFNYNTKIKSIIIPASVKKIEDYAFYNCSALNSITIYAETPPSCSGTAFRQINASAKIYVPSESVDKYKTASGWSNYASLIQAIPQE